MTENEALKDDQVNSRSDRIWKKKKKGGVVLVRKYLWPVRLWQFPFLFDHRRRDRQALSFSSLSLALAVQVSSVTKGSACRTLRWGKRKQLGKVSFRFCRWARWTSAPGLSAATLRSRTRKITTDVEWLRETENYAWRKDATERVARLPCCHLLTAHLTEEQQSIAWCQASAVCGCVPILINPEFDAALDRDSGVTHWMSSPGSALWYTDIWQSFFFFFFFFFFVSWVLFDKTVTEYRVWRKVHGTAEEVRCYPQTPGW